MAAAYGDAACKYVSCPFYASSCWIVFIVTELIIGSLPSYLTWTAYCNLFILRVNILVQVLKLLK